METIDKINKLKDSILIKKYKRWLITLGAFFIFIIIVIIGTTTAYHIKYKDKILPNVIAGGVNLGGLSESDAALLLDRIATDIENDGLKIIYNQDGQRKLKLTPSVNALNDPDLSRQLLEYNIYQTVEDAYKTGRNISTLDKIIFRIKSLFKETNIAVVYALDEATLKKSIKEQFSDIESRPKNSVPIIKKTGSAYQLVDFAEEQNGYIFDYDKIIKTIKKNLSDLKNPSVEIEGITKKPEIDLKTAKANSHLIERELNTSTPKFIYNEKKWQISKDTYIAMLELQNNNKQIRAGINYDLFEKWASDNIASLLDKESKNATMEIQDNKITNFQAHENGRQTDIKSTYDNINNLIGTDNYTTKVVVKETTPDVAVGDINDLGIKEIIGIGHSNFAGSPPNRRHNITVGAKALDGVLIEPGGEFSAMKNLGTINAEAGYLPELVIKGNKTVPEYGGGLCQIGTTAFRVGIESGLPITERRPHAYSVSYYLHDGKAGMDATVYDPHPDIRYINDTDHYLLMQTRIEGDDLYFELWGTKDERKVEIGELKNWDWVAPPATKYIETTNLKPGVKQCSESAHYGLKASFNYKVTYPDGKVNEETFFSQYKPWQAVCLIGVEELSEDAAEGAPEQNEENDNQQT